MFCDCENLTSLDLSNFNTDKVKQLFFMFYGCYKLKTIYVGDGWVLSDAAIEISENVFNGCNRLVGGKGTTYDVDHVDADYAHIDGGPSNPGYFTEKPAFILGDVNGDGSVSIIDVTALIDYLLTGEATSINLAAAECNGIEGITIGDVTALIDYLLSGAWPEAPQPANETLL
jgi:surface protein